MATSLEMDEAGSDVKFWLSQIEGSQKWHTEWHERGKGVLKRYMDDPSLASLEAKEAHKMNMLWSNVQTTAPALYAKAATPKVQRRFRDKDAVGRWAATVLERTEAYELDAYDDDYHYRAAILDYLLPGRGAVWVNYDPTVKDNRLVWECCRLRHINWKDFLTNPARTWDEVWWVAKREYLTKEEAKQQRLDVSKLTFEEQKDSGPDASAAPGDRIKKAAVWEIWSKTHGKVYFVSKQCPALLRPAAEPGLKFENFFPTPRPLTTTTTTDSILPVPDFVQYQNQAQEIDRLSQRINLLTKALRVAGVYDATQEALGNLLNDTDSNVLIPCETYAVLAAQGGIEGSVSFFPLKDIITALKQCYESREAAKAAMYEITGISDIVRGATDPSETATAQQIKSQWGGLRIRDRQKEVQRFIRDAMRLKAEVHAERFQPETLRTMSNVPLADAKTKQQLQMRQQAQQMAQQNPEAAQTAMQSNPQLQALAKPLTEDELQKLREPAWEEVIALLRNDKLRGFRIDIETDSTIQADEMEEKKTRTEFISSVTTFMETWGPIVQMQPKAAPLAGELLMFGCRAFKTADTLETAIEEFIEALSQMPAPQQGADPKAQAEMAKVKVSEQKVQQDGQLKREEMHLKADTSLKEHAMDIHAGAQQAGAQMQHDATLHREGAAQETQEAQKDRVAEQGSQQVMAAIKDLAQQVQQLAQSQADLVKQFGSVGTA
jgi:hypothetical protein